MPKLSGKGELDVAQKLMSRCYLSTSEFDKALEDDLNTSLATSLIHEHLKDLNKFIDNYGKSAIIEKSLNAVNDRLVNVFGINLKKEDIGNLTSNLLDLFIYYI